jgi:hypothetical protein
MGDEATDEPLPTIPLEYFQHTGQCWSMAVMWIVRLTLVLLGCEWLAYLAHVGFYFWQELGPHYRYRGFDGWPLVMRLPLHLAQLITLIGVFDALKLQEVGRRWIVAGALLMLCAGLPTEIVQAIYYHYARHHWLYGPQYVIGSFVDYTIEGAGLSIFPIFLLMFFRRSEVRAVFAMQPGDG